MPTFPRASRNWGAGENCPKGRPKGHGQACPERQVAWQRDGDQPTPSQSVGGGPGQPRSYPSGVAGARHRRDRPCSTSDSSIVPGYGLAISAGREEQHGPERYVRLEGTDRAIAHADVRGAAVKRVDFALVPAVDGTRPGRHMRGSTNLRGRSPGSGRRVRYGTDQI